MSLFMVHWVMSFMLNSALFCNIYKFIIETFFLKTMPVWYLGTSGHITCDAVLLTIIR